MWFTLLVQKRMQLPTTPAYYPLLAKDTARIQYGVDHSCVVSLGCARRPPAAGF
jgi:dimethylaniline monooxygenase (N-oxide forming)